MLIQFYVLNSFDCNDEIIHRSLVKRKKDLNLFCIHRYSIVVTYILLWVSLRRNIIDAKKSRTKIGVKMMLKDCYVLDRWLNSNLTIFSTITLHHFSSTVADILFHQMVIVTPCFKNIISVWILKQWKTSLALLSPVEVNLYNLNYKPVFFKRFCFNAWFKVYLLNCRVILT